jgi:hypothetical protein
MFIDQFLKNIDFDEIHHITINKPPESVYPCIWELDFCQSKIIRLLFTLRGLPRQMCCLKGCIDIGFILLAEEKNRELVLGLLIDPPRFRPARVTPEAFARFDKKHHIKVVWNFFLEPDSHGNTLLTTVTRVGCAGRLSRTIFGVYWLMISCFSGLIRKIMLGLIKKKAELDIPNPSTLKL